MNEIQILLEVLAEIGDEYEEQRQTSLPNDFWQHLHAAAEQLDCLEELKLYMRDGQRVRGLYRKAEDTPE